MASSILSGVIDRQLTVSYAVRATSPVAGAEVMPSNPSKAVQMYTSRIVTAQVKSDEGDLRLYRVPTGMVDEVGRQRDVSREEGRCEVPDGDCLSQISTATSFALTTVSSSMNSSTTSFDGYAARARTMASRTALTIASRQHARFKQTDADVGSFDAGYGSAYLAKQVGQKFAREIFFLGRAYDAETMQRMGAVNEVVDHSELEDTAIEFARAINAKSPTAQRMLKFAFNLTDDGLMGQQVFAGEATRLAHMTDEGRDAFSVKTT